MELFKEYTDLVDLYDKDPTHPQNIPTISDSIASFEKNDSAVLDIVGKSFEVGQDGTPTFTGLTALSKAMNVYSNKQFETARYLFVKDGTIIRHLAISSNTPSSTIYKQNEDFLSKIASYAKETDSKIVFLHNHPSGLIEPSEADINQTNYLTNYFEQKDGSNLFSGHIILDHGKFGLYTAEDRKWGALIDDKLHSFDEFNRQFTLEVSAFSKGLFNDVQKNYGYTPSEFRNTMLNPDKSVSSQTLLILYEYAKKCDAGEMWNKKDWIPTFFMNENNIVTSLEYTNLIELESIDSFSDKLKMIGRNYGSENVIFFPNTYDQFLSCERYAHLTNKVKEIYYQNPDGTFELSQYNNGNIFNDTKISDITIDDTEQYPDEVKKKIFYEQSVKNTRNNVNINNLRENKTMAKITDEKVSVENSNDNMLARDAATNYILEKLSKAGIEVVTDKEEFERISEQDYLIKEKTVEQFMTLSNGITYGFTHEGKIYLNPDVMNSNAAVHEYTHLWDFYTQKTDPELWQKGLTIFKDTDYWKEVLNDPNYQDIKDDENLVLSEIHGRICGKMAEKNLEKIAELDGEQVKFDAIDWDNEVNEFIAEEFGIRPELGTENYISDSVKAALLKDFLSSPMKDLFINERNFEIEKENQQEQTESLNQSDSELSDLNKDNPSEIEREGLHKSFEYDGLTYIPVRSLLREEKEIINNRTPKEIWENAIIEKPKNGDDYSLNEFIEKAQAETGNESADLFYCIEKGKFFTPVENGIVNLNENSINEHFNAELQKFYNSPDIQNIIKTNRPLVFDKTKDLELTNNLTSVISDGEVFTKKNENLGDIRVKLGNLKHGGINHIIKRRMDKLIQHDGKSYEEAVKETSAILFLAVKNISEAPATKETNGRFAVYKNGIKTVIGKDDNGRYVVSGFDFEDTKQEATDSIKSVNALYGYTPEFLEIYAQVGAAYASLNNTINYNNSAVNDSLSAENTRKPEQQSKIEELENKVRSMQTLFEKYQSMMEENATLRQEIELLKSQQSQSDTQAMGEQGAGSISKSENRNTEAFEMSSFNRDTAFKEKTKVPRFGIADDKTRKIEIIEGAVFSRLIENKLDNSKNEVALSILNKDGTHREIIITEQRYNDMINAQRILEEKKASVSQDRKYEWELIFENYNKIMMTDENNFRMNTSENFIHNFRIHCKLEANNQEEAIKCAADMVSRMTPVERKRFNLMRKQAGGEVFDRLLMKEFEDISKEKHIKEKDLSFDKDSTNDLLYEANKKYLELESGEKIEGTEKKVGDSIVFSIKTAGLDGKIRKTPKAEFKIVKVTKNQIPDRAIIFNEKTKASYTIPLSDLKKHIQKVEKERIKEEKKQIKKDNKRVGYEGQSL